MDRKKEFEKFYNSNIDKLYRFVFFRVGKNRVLTEDLVSEIFMKVLEHFESYDETKSRTAWLYTIAKNHLANYWRDNKETLNLPDFEDEDDTDDLDRKLFQVNLEEFKRQEEKGSVYDILSSLPPEDQEIVTFHYLYGYSYLEIAEIVGKSEAAVKVSAHRAIKKLKESL